jgi:hypothetical protein
MVPENIRQVERPLNTVVENTGRPGFKQYPVRERKGGVRVNGKYQPHNGIVIGYIYEGRFIPKETKLTTNADMKAYGQAALVHSVVDDIELDLTSVFDIKQAYQIISIACLRVINAGISCRYLKSEYDASFISEYYPNLGLSSSTLTELLKSLGKDLKKRQEFYLRRLTAVCEKHRIAIDGSLFQDTSNINDLSGYSHKARVKGCADISLLFAFDIDLREPLCAQVFPGCEIDASSYEAFITNNKIEKGILVTDKGFPPSKIKKLLETHRTLHYLTPIKCNDKRILEYDMLSFEGVLLNIDKNVRYKKCQVSENLFLYSFQDGSRATGQFMKALEQAKKEGSYDHEAFLNKEKVFGVIVFESDQDLPPDVIYQYYSERWLLELIFRTYKSNLLLDETNVQSDYSVYGSEFINFISVVITCRIVKKMSNAGLLETESYKEVMRDLDRVWRKTEGFDRFSKSIPLTSDTEWVHTYPKVMNKMLKLGLAQEAYHQEHESKSEEDNNKSSKKTNDTEDQNSSNSDGTEKRKGGRPRIHPKPDPNAPKRPRGRPRVRPIPDPDAPKRKPGRPKTRPEVEGPKRPRGRPKGSRNKNSEK